LRVASSIRTPPTSLPPSCWNASGRSALPWKKIVRRAGFKSLFVYCLETLRLSEDAICNRLEVARAARKFPIILDRFADGSVTLTAVRLLAPHLTVENHAVLLREATHKRTEQVKELVARISPRPDIASPIRKLPPPRGRAGRGDR
jgi:hypothetical protein